MYDKGIILEIKDKYCLAMTEQGAVIRIHKKQGMHVGDHIYILPEDLCEEEKPSGVVVFPKAGRSRSFMKAAVCAAAAFLLVFASIFTGQGEAYAMVSAVGAGDVELELDKDYRIIRVKVYGASAEEEKQLSGLVGKTLEEAQPLLRGMTGPKGVIVGYALKKRGGPAAEAELARRLELVFSGEEAVYLKGNADDVKSAKAKTVSLGFYMAQKAAEDGNRESRDILEYRQKVREQKEHYDGPDRGSADGDDGKTDGQDSGDGDDDDDRDSGEKNDDRDGGDEKDDDGDSGEKEDDRDGGDEKNADRDHRGKKDDDRDGDDEKDADRDHSGKKDDDRDGDEKDADRDSGDEKDGDRDSGDEKDGDRDSGGKKDNDRHSGGKKDGNQHSGAKPKPIQSQPASKPEDNQPESAAKPDEAQTETAESEESNVQDHSGSSGSHGEDDKDSNKKDSDDGDSQNSGDDNDNDNDNDNDSGDSDDDD